MSAIDIGGYSPDAPLKKRGHKGHSTKASSKASLSEPSSKYSRPKLTTRKEKIKAYRPYTYKALGSNPRKNKYKLSKSQDKTPAQGSFLEYLFRPGRAEAKARATYRSAKSSKPHSDSSKETSTAPPSEPLSKDSSRTQSKITSSKNSPQGIFSSPFERLSRQSSENEAPPKVDKKKERKHPSKGDRLLLWMLKSGGITEKYIDKRLAQRAARRAASKEVIEKETTSKGSVSSPGTEKDETSTQESVFSSAPKKTWAKNSKKASSSKKTPGLFDTFGRRTKEQPWDAFDLLAPWMLSSKEKKKYDQTVKELNEERARQGKPKK